MRAHVASFQNIKIIAILFLIAATLVNGITPQIANAAPVADAISVTSVQDIGKEDPNNAYDLARWEATFSTGETCNREMNIHRDMPATGEVQSFSKPWWSFGTQITFTDADGNSWLCTK
jgi:hypothetical protein